MLLEHVLLASGDVAEAGAVYAGWPAHVLEQRCSSEDTTADISEVMEIAELSSDKDRLDEEASKRSFKGEA